jgi:hypothetical protein
MCSNRGDLNAISEIKWFCFCQVICCPPLSYLLCNVVKCL